jgi:nucleolar protein 56
MPLTVWFGQVNEDPSTSVLVEGTDQIIEKLIDLNPSPNDAQPNLRALAIESRLIDNDTEYNLLLRKVAIGLVKKRLRSLVTTEQEVLQLIETIDDFDHAINLLEERLYEWSLLYRDDISRKKEAQIFNEGNCAANNLATAIKDLKRSRHNIEDAIDLSISTIAPNLTNLAGPLLAARLISRAGSLHRLSQLPSSAIQIMGAEKSLFKHLNGNAPSPKHGLIYRHPTIFNAPKRLRGRLSRAISGKLAIASRIDYHTGLLSPGLKDSLENRISEIKRIGRKKI